MLNGVVIDPNATYRMTVSSYLAGGADAFTVLAEGTNRLFGGMDCEALASYISANAPVASGPIDRFVNIP